MSTNSKLEVKNGVSFAKDEQLAVQELYDQIYQPEAEVVIFFCSSKYDLEKMGNALNETFSCHLIGCTTSGEITPTGYHEGSLVGVSIASDEIKIHSRLISPLSDFSMDMAEKMARDIQDDLSLETSFNIDKMFGYLLIDGMSMQEEHTISLIHSQFENISIIGGSAGDDLQFSKTAVYWDGKFISNAAAFSLFETNLPFHIFKTQHFKPTDMKLVITKADPANRCVMEINCEPAAKEYADVLGLTIDELTPTVFSNHPVMLRIGGEYYVRSIQHVNEDKSLSFYCAIDNGLVLTIAEGVGLVDNLEEQLSEVKEKIPKLKLILGFDCILRRLEIMEKKMVDPVIALIKDKNFFGFSTYGEQYNAIHVNQTLTGVAIGEEE